MSTFTKRGKNGDASLWSIITRVIILIKASQKRGELRLSFWSKKKIHEVSLWKSRGYLGKAYLVWRWPCIIFQLNSRLSCAMISSLKPLFFYSKESFRVTRRVFHSRYGIRLYGIYILITMVIISLTVVPLGGLSPPFQISIVLHSKNFAKFVQIDFHACIKVVEL